MQTANAATDTSIDPASSLVQKIADKFNLNRDDVQAVFDAQRTEMDAQREQEMSDQLASAVTNGKLTQDQADKITAKIAQMKASRDKFKNMTDDERKAAMESARSDLEQWAKDNAIPMEYLRPAGHGPRLR